MAEETAKPKRQIRKVESLREKAEKAAADNNKQPRRLREKTRRLGGPFRAIGRALGFISRFIVPPYFRNSWKELRQVTWPKFGESMRLTFAVIVFSIIFGVLVAVLDLGLDKVFKEVLLQ